MKITNCHILSKCHKNILYKPNLLHINNTCLIYGKSQKQCCEIEFLYKNLNLIYFEESTDTTRKLPTFHNSLSKLTTNYLVK